MATINQGVIASIVDEAKMIKVFNIELLHPLTPLPGQYVMVAFPDDLVEKRAFSIVDYDAADKTLTLGIKKVGKVTSRLFDSRVGQELLVYGPYGRFTLSSSEKSAVFIAGGIGISPIYYMLKNVANMGYTDVYLLYAARGIRDVAFYKEIVALSKGPVKVHLILTELQGRIDSTVISQVVPCITDKEFYICGPPGMIEGLREQLLVGGVPEARIKSEEIA